MLDRKLQWRTADEEVVTKKLSYNISDDSIVLEPQRIRVFEVTYKVSDQEMFLN